MYCFVVCLSLLRQDLSCGLVGQEIRTVFPGAKTLIQVTCFATQRFPFWIFVYTSTEVTRILRGSAPSTEQITCVRNPVSVMLEPFLLCWVPLPTDVSNEEPSLAIVMECV